MEKKKKKKLTYRRLLQLFAKSDKRYDEKLAKERQERDEQLVKERQLREQEFALSKQEAEQRKKEYDEQLVKERQLREQEFALRKKEYDEKLEKESQLRDEQLVKERQEREQREKEFNEKMSKMFSITDKKIGEITNTLGKFAQEMVAPKLTELFQKRGLQIQTIAHNIFGVKDNKKFYEIDLLLVGPQVVVIVEVKTKLSVEYVNDHLERLDKIEEIAPNLGNLSGKVIYGAVAGIIIEQDADRYAYKKGLFVVRQNGNLVEISNDENFVPKEWRSEY